MSRGQPIIENIRYKLRTDLFSQARSCLLGVCLFVANFVFAFNFGRRDQEAHEIRVISRENSCSVYGGMTCRLNDVGNLIRTHVRRHVGSYTVLDESL